jgi:hypothetical protein
MTQSPSQNFVPISEIRDGIVMLKNGEMRAVLLATPLNLGLKSFDEQQATINGFQNFLNALEFPIQIVSSSRRLDIRPYLLSLENRIPEIQEELLRVQTREYIEFIRWFNEQYNIMSKFFYIVVPYSGGFNSTKQTNMLAGLGDIFRSSNTAVTSIDNKRFEETRSQVEQRIAVVQQGLTGVGVQTTQLDTAALIEMYHGLFNPGELSVAVASDVNKK